MASRSERPVPPGVDGVAFASFSSAEVVTTTSFPCAKTDTRCDVQAETLPVFLTSRVTVGNPGVAIVVFVVLVVLNAVSHVPSLSKSQRTCSADIASTGSRDHDA